MFTEEQIRRYSRHIILKEVGGKGQERLLASRVLVLGLGGLGAPVAYYLAAAGVGKLGLCDPDRVDLSNLQRQIIHHEADLGKPKIVSAAEKLAALNPDVRLELHQDGLTPDNALQVIGQYELVVDGTDNFSTRYLVADACHHLRVPYVYGSIFRFEGQVSLFDPGNGPCYRCLYPEAPPPGLAPSCQEAGVLGVLPGVVGTIQATEAIKRLLGIGETLAGKLLLYDALEMEFRRVNIHRDPACPLCGPRPSIDGLNGPGYDHACRIG